MSLTKRDYFAQTAVRQLLKNDEIRRLVSGCLNPTEGEDLAVIVDYDGTFDDLCHARGKGLAAETVARIINKLDTYFFFCRAGVKKHRGLDHR